MDILKKLRKNKGITQAELGKVLGVSPSTIGMYEQGRRTPDKNSLLALARFFNVTTDYLLGNDSNRIDSPAPTYYLDPETAEMAEELHKRKDMRMLFHAAKSSTPEDVKMVTDMLERFKNS